eukprot:8856517-Pyramimonas_sp.AAC.1
MTRLRTPEDNVALGDTGCDPTDSCLFLPTTPLIQPFKRPCEPAQRIQPVGSQPVSPRATLSSGVLNL